jgi:hypothetical protein
MSVFVEESQSVGAGRLCAQSEPNLLCRYKEGAGLQEPHRTFAPLRVGESLDAALRLYRQAPLPIMGLSALFVVPYTVAGLYINPTATGSMLAAPFLRAAGKPVPLAPPQAVTGPGIVAAIAAAILAPLVYCALVRIADQARRGEPPAMGKALVWSLRRLFALLITGLMSVIAVGVLSLAALFVSTTVMGIGMLAVNGGKSAGPGIFAMIWVVVAFVGSALLLHGVWLSFLFVPHVIVLENRGYFRAIGRSLSLAVPRLFRTVGVVWSAVLLTLSLSYVTSLPQLLWDQAVGATGINVVLHLAQGVVRIFTFPLLALITTVAYHDYRLRAEGLDLAERLSKLEGEAGHA